MRFTTTVWRPQSLEYFKPKVRIFCFGAVSSSRLYSAHNLFDKSPDRDRESYTSLLFGFSRDGRTQEATRLFLNIHRLGMEMDCSIFSSVLKVSATLCDELFGRQLHCQCIKFGFLDDVSVGTSLVDTYMKGSNFKDGRNVFDEMKERNVVTWTTLISGYARNSLNEEVLTLFMRMQNEGTQPNSFTFAAALGVLAEEGVGGRGLQVHTVVVKNGLDRTIPVSNSLINLYLKCGNVRKARILFDKTEVKSVVTWNSMISGYAANGLDLEALGMFYSMRLNHVRLSESSFASIIKLCANLKELRFTEQLHCSVVKYGFVFDQNIRTALMVAYSKCMAMLDALRLFKETGFLGNVVSWTAMISGFLQNDGKEEAVDLFSEMKRKGVRPNKFTYSVVLTALPAISPSEVHAQVVKTNYERSSTVGTALLDAYVKLGKVDEAAKVFSGIDDKDIVAWSAMLAGFAQTGETEAAIKMFGELTKGGGKQFHGLAIKSRLDSSICVSSALLTMYAKKGNIESAEKVFKRQREKDLVSWNSMISGYAQHGQAMKALDVFKEMKKRKVKMDSVTFIGVFAACTHAGLVEEGEKYFDIMVRDCKIVPTKEHNSCMVDLYSRAGQLEKAMKVIDNMPNLAGSTIWRTILAACRVYKKTELGRLAAEKIIAMKPEDSAAYVLLSNMYAESGDWQERAKVRKLMNERNVKKEPGYSWIEVKNKTYAFLAGDRSHPLKDQIYMKLEDLSTRLKDLGYEPDTNYVLQDIDDEHKEAVLAQHSERLAIAFGLIATPKGSPLLIIKNLRVCGDCHVVIKLIAKIEEREIVVRDSNRFHHFSSDGVCSCGDFW
ncbi:Pentatricopeptide repeat [Arabidopsis suecica]|uniref:Pentatricopeptide repeat n=1 Tax=Arabidopsis suecica TaxID=45249 RepID=A0A8T2AJ71_ARASU|nr:Pentatricopeptide repeat [Arabidopsis suecica]